MSFTRKALPMFRLITRQFATKKEPPKIVVRKQFAKLKETQKRFSCDDGLPVWLKNGATDKILYQLSWALIFLGLGLSVEVYVRIIMKNLGIGQEEEENSA
ncbi:cytochrome c oxidase subunit 7A, mitochondrial-like [Tribolium madens]|uniref:cytochrome c oxidase subunit 7A, mitochondrial-like n=1 Tax=Tribolium madens TaxID=41895 RepID=UPI001CF73584|nr:cytochrome c oxidase subunit 7A, mitochondrial-like [Tribolium madens]